MWMNAGKDIVWVENASILLAASNALVPRVLTFRQTVVGV